MRKSRTAEPGIRKPAAAKMQSTARMGRPPLSWDTDGIDGEPPRKYAPEEVLALHVFFQAVLDVRSGSSVPDRDRHTAAQFLRGDGAFCEIHAFWAAVLGLSAAAARAQAMQQHGTAIARIISHYEKQAQAVQAAQERRSLAALRRERITRRPLLRRRIVEQSQRE